CSSDLAGARGWIDADGQPLSLALDFDRSRGDGRVYVDLDAASLSAWAPLLEPTGITPQGGSGRIQAWAELRGRRVVLATTRFELRGPGLSGHVIWRLVAGGWRLDAPRLQLQAPGSSQTLDGLLLAAGEQYAFRIDDVELSPLLALAALSDRLPAAHRAWLLDAAPHAR